MIGNDDVCDAALKRAGALRANNIEQLFNAAEILSSKYLVKGNCLTIVTNSGGAGVMAADRATECLVKTPELSAETYHYLNTQLLESW